MKNLQKDLRMVLTYDMMFDFMILREIQVKLLIIITSSFGLATI